MSNSNYNNNVFINCPFDEQFIPLFRAITFTILDCGFIPRCSLEVSDATQFRLKAILDIVSESRYGVHDLSRVKLDDRFRLPRFNMPFELGIFFAAKHFGEDEQKRKQCIVLEKAKYRYQKYISDISGIDVAAHGNVINSIVSSVRNWLVTASRRRNIPAAADVSNRFKKFDREIKKICAQRSIDYESMPFIEITRNMSDWLALNQLEDDPLFQRFIT